MNIDDFRRIALSLEGAEESSHMGKPDFRLRGRIFATLASADQGYGNLMLAPEQQAAFVQEMPEVFVPAIGGWGRMGITHIRLAAAHEDVLTGAFARPGSCGSIRMRSQGERRCPKTEGPDLQSASEADKNEHDDRNVAQLLPFYGVWSYGILKI